MAGDSPLPVGAVLTGRYQIRRELGRGGMGFVYLCRDLVLDERVALKIMPRGTRRSGSQSGAGENRRPRRARHDDAWFFFEEARALAGLCHPTIVRARDYGVLDDGAPFIVMDVVPGRSLHELIYRARTDGLLPWPVVWQTIDQVLGGLGHAHARGVIHGDLKPSNVLLDMPTPDVEPRAHILDLGLAWLMRDLVDHRLDGTREVAPTVRYGAGTPGWMAPEQIRMETPLIGPATDLYALGCIIFTLLSGDEPYQGSSKELLERHKSAPIPALVPPAAVPAATADIVRRMMAKHPSERYMFAGEVRREWRRLAPAGQSGALPGGSEDELGTSSNPGPPSETTLQGEEPFEVATTAVATPGLLGLRPSPMVARFPERSELMGLAREVSESAPAVQRLVVLAGPAGVGKSRLAEWLCEEAHEQALLLPLRARYRKIAAPLDGVVGALVQHYRIEKSSRSAIEQLLLSSWQVDPGDQEELSWVAGAAAWLCRGEPHPEEMGPTGKRVVIDREEIRMQVILHTLQRTAAGHGLLLWLDDLHRAPPATFRRLARIRRDLTAVPMLLVGTMRSEDVASDATARARVELLLEDMRGTRMELEPLSLQETRQLLRETLPLDDETAEATASRAKGNPLFALQLLHAWAMRGELVLDKGGLYRVAASALQAPAATTADLWEERLRALPPELRPAAMAASALGGDIRLDVLRVLLTSLDLPADRAITAMSRAQLLLLAGSDRLRWTHALLQEHLLAGLFDLSDRRRVFRAAADALAHHPAAGSGRIVRHRVTNLERAGEFELAGTVLHDHVERAWGQARDPSRTLLDLELLDGKLPGLGLARHLRWRGEALRYAGRIEEARSAAEQARLSFHEAADYESEAHCLRLLGHISSDLGASAQGRRQATQALSIFQSLGHGLGQAQCEVLLGEIDYLLGDHARALESLGQAAARCAAVGDVLGHGQCLILQGFVAQAGGAPGRARELHELARGDMERIGYRLGVAQCDLALAHGEHQTSDFVKAHERAAATLKSFHLVENPRGEAGAERLLAMIALDGGHPNTAEVHARAAGVLYARLTDPWGQAETLLLLAQVALYRGDTAAALRRHRRGRGRAPAAPAPDARLAGLCRGPRRGRGARDRAGAPRLRRRRAHGRPHAAAPAPLRRDGLARARRRARRAVATGHRRAVGEREAGPSAPTASSASGRCTGWTRCSRCRTD
ncbi:MAG: protein kinase [Deltaproteobacteria bacterium]|nr:protein kinase [Deltaproteobacteria bacterium]